MLFSNLIFILSLKQVYFIEVDFILFYSYFLVGGGLCETAKVE